MGILVDKTYQGAGQGFQQGLFAIQEFSRVDPDVGDGLLVHNMFVNPVLQQFGSFFLKSAYLPQLCQEKIGGVCISQAGTEQDEYAIQTIASRQGSTWTLDGTMIGLSNAHVANLFIAFAATEQTTTCFLVEKEWGVVIEKQEPTQSLLRFQKVQVPKSHIIGQVGQGQLITAEMFSTSLLTTTAQVIGHTQSALDGCLTYMNNKQMSNLVSQYDQLKGQFLDLQKELEKASLLLEKASVLKMNQQDFTAAGEEARSFALKVRQDAESVCGILHSQIAAFIKGFE